MKWLRAASTWKHQQPMLKQNKWLSFFGDEFKISEAYIKEAMDWPIIRP